jgi:RNA polymerase sigma-70 factor (ECF subfamily)
MNADAGASPSDDHFPKAEDLLARIARREAAALSQLYDCFAHALRAVAIRFLHEEAEADDVLQEVFLKVWDHAQDYAPAQGTPATWLITIARNASLNRLRARQRKAAALERAAAEPEPDAPRSDSAYECLVSAERAALVRQALAELPDEQRVPLELAYLHGLTYEAVAERLGHPLGSVKSRLRRGMARMKTLLIARDPHTP